VDSEEINIYIYIYIYIYFSWKRYIRKWRKKVEVILMFKVATCTLSSAW